MVLDVDGLIFDECASAGFDGIGVTVAIVIDDSGNDVVGAVAHHRIVGNIVGLDQTHVNHTLVLHAVGKILDKLRTEEIVALVADGIGDVNAHGTQRIQTIAASRLQITVGTCQRIHHHHKRVLAVDILHIADGVRRIHVHIIGNLSLLRVLLGMNLVTGRRSEVTVVAQDCVDHIDTGIGIDTPDEHGFCGKVLVEPALETGGILVDVVVNHQAKGKRRAVIGRIQGVVGLDIDGRENVFLHAFVQLGTILVVLEMLHARVEHIVLAQLLCRRACDSHPCEHRDNHNSNVFPIRRSHLLSFGLLWVYQSPARCRCCPEVR